MRASSFPRRTTRGRGGVRCGAWLTAGLLAWGLLLPWAFPVAAEPEARVAVEERATSPRPQKPPAATRPPARQQTEREPAQRIDIEATYYRQPALVETALKALQPRTANAANLYFVGFAAFAGQDVFRREVTATRELFDKSFGTRGHSLLLINHRETLDAVPLASASNLEAVLKGVGARMDREADVLFLFLTSHGTEGLLAVDFGRFFLNNLTPERLDGMLQRSGIRNAVIVVSACHSGSFLPALRGLNRVVIAAARADRTSFGCSSERAWTYFGDAYFNHALRETASFAKAFERAKDLVGQWEKAEKYLPSEPQISIGAQIGDKLAAIEKRVASLRAAQAGE